MKKDKPLLHYSRYGYEGNYMYKSVCGKEVKTHQDDEDSTIRPQEVNCPDCLNTKEYATDLNDLLNTPTGTKRRLYIESDILQADEFRSALREVKGLCKDSKLPYVGRVFSEVLDFAWHDLEGTWEAVKKADEIYATSSLVPLCGNSYMGAPVIFNGMCERAVKEGVIGKSVILLTNIKYVNWHMIDIPLSKKPIKH